MDNQGKRVLITGISGFVGSYLARELINRGYEVYGLVRKRSQKEKIKRLEILHIYNDVKLLDGDITNLTSLLMILNKIEPEVIFHLAAQSYVPYSFQNPLETFYPNCLGTQNLLEAVRLSEKIDPKIVFAGSSEEYGLQIISQKHYEKLLKVYGSIIPEPVKIPELPIDENNPLRPLSPYAVSKVFGELIMRNYYYSYSIKTIVSRAFNHEGALRGHQFVTSSIVRQCIEVKLGERKTINLGNVNVFRDWSHVEDIINGYILLSERGRYGDCYVFGSMRTNSVLTYVLLTLKELGYEILRIETLNKRISINNPIDVDNEGFFSIKFEKTLVDNMLLKGEIEFSLEDEGIKIYTNKGSILIKFDKERFRPADVPILLSYPKKAKEKLKWEPEKKLNDIIRDQINYYLDLENRKNALE